MQFDICSGNLWNVDFIFENCLKLEFDRAVENQKNCIFFYLFYPAPSLPLFIPSFSLFSVFLFVLTFLSLCDKYLRWTMWKEERFIWLIFRGLHLKQTGGIQKGVALGTCWEVYSGPGRLDWGDKGRGECKLFWCILLMTYLFQTGHTCTVLLASIISLILNSTVKDSFDEVRASMIWLLLNVESFTWGPVFKAWAFCRRILYIQATTILYPINCIWMVVETYV